MKSHISGTEHGLLYAPIARGWHRPITADPNPLWSKLAGFSKCPPSLHGPTNTTKYCWIVETVMGEDLGGVGPAIELISGLVGGCRRISLIFFISHWRGTLPHSIEQPDAKISKAWKVLSR